MSLEDGEVHEVLSEMTPVGPRFSEDGETLLYSTATRTKTSYTRRDGTDYGLFALDLSGGEPRSLIEPTEERISAVWSRLVTDSRTLKMVQFWCTCWVQITQSM